MGCGGKRHWTVVFSQVTGCNLHPGGGVTQHCQNEGYGGGVNYENPLRNLALRSYVRVGRLRFLHPPASPAVLSKGYRENLVDKSEPPRPPPRKRNKGEDTILGLVDFE